MTSLSVFQPYVDKENADAVGARPKIRGNSVSGLGGKVFQSNTSSLVTPRKALRDVNQGLSLSVNGQGIKPQQKLIGLAPQQELFKKPLPQPPDTLQSTSKSNRNQVSSHKKPKSCLKTNVQEKVTVKKPEPLPDIEKMYIFDEKEDYKPLKEIDFSGVISKLINWRPPCLFGSRPDMSDSESETEEEKFERIDRAIEMMKPQDIDVFEDEKLFDFEDLPYIDVEIPELPSLSDSFDLELGSLELHNSSTPVWLSPNAKLKQL